AAAPRAGGLVFAAAPRLQCELRLLRARAAQRLRGVRHARRGHAAARGLGLAAALCGQAADRFLERAPRRRPWGCPMAERGGRQRLRGPDLGKTPAGRGPALAEGAPAAALDDLVRARGCLLPSRPRARGRLVPRPLAPALPRARARPL